MSQTIRNLELHELETLLDWAEAEGWNPGMVDAPAFHAADPQGFLGLFVDGTLVAGISAVAYDAHFGFIGLYICHPDWRGQGYGKAVWDAGMAYLGGRTIGLDGVPEQVANYARAGFVRAYDTVRMSGTLEPGQGTMLPPAQLEMIERLDALAFPAPRRAFLRRWLAPPHQSLMVARDAGATGYAVLRACREGAKLGPLFAADLAAAIAILDCMSGPVHIDVPLAQTEWLALLESRGFVAGFRTTRMYRGAAPQLATELVFGITSLELG